jgi:hypothetical protein
MFDLASSSFMKNRSRESRQPAQDRFSGSRKLFFVADQIGAGEDPNLCYGLAENLLSTECVDIFFLK